MVSKPSCAIYLQVPGVATPCDHPVIGLTLHSYLGWELSNRNYPAQTLNMGPGTSLPERSGYCLAGRSTNIIFTIKEGTHDDPELIWL